MERRFFLMRFPEGRAKTLTFSYDDGVVSDLRFMKLLNQYGMKGTFNVNSALYGPETPNPEKPTRRLSKSQLLEMFADGRHEIAVHALTHPFLDTLPSGAVAYEVVKDRENLEHQFGRIVRGMAYPMGTFSDDVVTTLRQCGIVCPHHGVYRKIQAPHRLAPSSRHLPSQQPPSDGAGKKLCGIPHQVASADVLSLGTHLRI